MTSRPINRGMSLNKRNRDLERMRHDIRGKSTRYIYP